MLEKKFRDDFNKIQATAANHLSYSSNLANNNNNSNIPNISSNPSSPMHGTNNMSNHNSNTNMQGNGVQHGPTMHRIHIPNTSRYEILLKQKHIQVNSN